MNILPKRSTEIPTVIQYIPTPDRVHVILTWSRSFNARKRFPIDGKTSNIKKVPSEIAFSFTAGHSSQNSWQMSFGA